MRIFRNVKVFPVKHPKSAHPADPKEVLRRVNQARGAHLQETGQEPDPQTLAEKMEMPEEKIRKILKISKEPISMETPIGDDDDSHLGDFIEDLSTVAPSDAAVNASLRNECSRCLRGPHSSSSTPPTGIKRTCLRPSLISNSSPGLRSSMAV